MAAPELRLGARGMRPNVARRRAPPKSIQRFCPHEEGAAQIIAPRIAAATIALLAQPERAAVMGRAGREGVLTHWSIDRMVRGYEDLITGIYRDKCASSRRQPFPSDRANRAAEARGSRQ